MGIEAGFIQMGIEAGFIQIGIQTGIHVYHTGLWIFNISGGAKKRRFPSCLKILQKCLCNVFLGIGYLNYSTKTI